MRRAKRSKWIRNEQIFIASGLGTSAVNHKIFYRAGHPGLALHRMVFRA
jgi:hypothetical protein